jgi:NAD(P)-dependent dehydrogenase (short-subunit alcohol dehydrogenase family)
MNTLQHREPAQDRQPGRQHSMRNEPVSIRDTYRGSAKLEGRRAYISGGDSGIGRAVALHFAREGADVAISYLNEHADAEETCRLVQREGRRCAALAADLSQEDACWVAVAKAAGALGGLDLLVNNVAQQFPVDAPEQLDEAQLRRTFETNVFSYYHTTLAALRYLPHGSCIINSSSITGSRGHDTLLDYSATKGAINAMTAAFAKSLRERGIRVNAVAPGPVWTPLIPASFDAEAVARFGRDSPMGRPAQPCEIAPAYVFLASEDASYINGIVMPVNGGSHIDV